MYYEFLPIIAIIISIISVIISIVFAFWNKKTKNYELTSVYWKELLNWYGNVAELLVSVRDDISAGGNTKEKLAKLSALIDLGRFYFPNTISPSAHGSEKPLAFQGHRNITLDLLVCYYDISKRGDANSHIHHLIDLQRFFTSRVFETLEPRVFIKKARSFTSVMPDEEYSLENFLQNQSKPELLLLYKQGKEHSY